MNASKKHNKHEPQTGTFEREGDNIFKTEARHCCSVLLRGKFDTTATNHQFKYSVIFFDSVRFTSCKRLKSGAHSSLVLRKICS